MPTYEYECKACEHKFSVFQSMKDEPLKTCPECKKPKLKRLIGTGAGIIFKGSGFYCTDYKSSTHGAPKHESKEESSSKSSESPSEASKPAEKPAEKSSGSKGSSKGKTDAA